MRECFVVLAHAVGIMALMITATGVLIWWILVVVTFLRGMPWL